MHERRVNDEQVLNQYHLTIDAYENPMRCKECCKRNGLYTMCTLLQEECKQHQLHVRGDVLRPPHD